LDRAGVRVALAQKVAADNAMADTREELAMVEAALADTRAELEQARSALEGQQQ
jgi:hypothetical protein